jgi:hypothetical protein
MLGVLKCDFAPFVHNFNEVKAKVTATHHTREIKKVFILVLHKECYGLYNLRDLTDLKSCVCICMYICSLGFRVVYLIA